VSVIACNLPSHDYFFNYTGMHMAFHDIDGSPIVDSLGNSSSLPAGWDASNDTIGTRRLGSVVTPNTTLTVPETQRIDVPLMDCSLVVIEKSTGKVVSPLVGPGMTFN